MISDEKGIDKIGEEGGRGGERGGASAPRPNFCFGGGAVARWRGDDDVRVLASARCYRRRGEDATINIRWEVRGGRVTKGGVEVVAVRGVSRFCRPTIHCASADN